MLLAPQTLDLPIEPQTYPPRLSRRRPGEGHGSIGVFAPFPFLGILQRFCLQGLSSVIFATRSQGEYPFGPGGALSFVPPPYTVSPPWTRVWKAAIPISMASIHFPEANWPQVRADDEVPLDRSTTCRL